MNKKFPHYHQLDSMGCGPAYLKRILSHYDDEIPIQILRNKCNISAAANSLGYATTGVKLTFEEYNNSSNSNKSHFPIIIEFETTHIEELKTNETLTIKICTDNRSLLHIVFAPILSRII